MGSSNNCIPSNSGKFIVWVKNFFTNENNAVSWNIVPASWLRIYPPMISAYETAYTKAEEPNRDKADVKAKNDVQDSLKKAVLQYIKKYLAYNSDITGEDRERIGLPSRLNSKTTSSGKNGLFRTPLGKYKRRKRVH